MMQDNLSTYSQSDFDRVKSISNSMIDLRIISFIRNGVNSLEEVAKQLRAKPEQLANAINSEIFTITGDAITLN